MYFLRLNELLNQPTQLVVRRRKKLSDDQPGPWLFSLGQIEGSSSIAWLARTVRQAHVDRPCFIPETRVDQCGELQWITLLDLDDWEGVAIEWKSPITHWILRLVCEEKFPDNPLGVMAMATTAAQPLQKLAAREAWSCMGKPSLKIGRSILGLG